MSTSALAGSGSVIDVQGIVNQLVQIEQRPVAVAKARVSGVDVSISAMSQLKALVDKVASSSKALEDALMLAGRSVSNSDATIMRASVTDAAAASPGASVVRNTVLATAQRTAFAGFSVASESLPDGSFRFDSISSDFAGNAFVAGTAYRVVSLGSAVAADWEAFSGSVAVPAVGDVFTPATSGTLPRGATIIPTAISLATPTPTTLEGLRDQINNRSDLTGKIAASIINIGRDVGTSTVSAGTRYRVSTLGSSTLAQWQAIDPTLTQVPSVGQIVTAGATGTLAGGGALSPETWSVTSGKTYRVASLGNNYSLQQWQTLFGGLAAVPSIGDVITATATGAFGNAGDTTVPSLFSHDPLVLALTASATGSTASFSAGFLDQNGIAQAGLSANSGLSQTPGNATALVNGIAVESKSNTFTNAIPGLSFDLLKADSSASGATATVSDNRATLKDRLKTFAADLTALNQGLSKFTKPGSKDEQAGPLAGNSGILGLSLAVSSAYSAGFTITEGVGRGNAYRWSDLGLEANRDGSYTIRQTDLDKAIDGITTGYGSAREIGREMLGGFTSTIRSTLNTFGGTAGTIRGSLEVLQLNRSRLASNVSELEAKVERTRKTLVAKYAALDAKLAGMNQMSMNVRSSLGRLAG